MIIYYNWQNGDLLLLWHHRRQHRPAAAWFYKKKLKFHLNFSPNLIQISLPQTRWTVALPLSPLTEAGSLHTNVLMDQVLWKAHINNAAASQINTALCFDILNYWNTWLSKIITLRRCIYCTHSHHNEHISQEVCNCYQKLVPCGFVDWNKLELKVPWATKNIFGLVGSCLDLRGTLWNIIPKPVYMSVSHITGRWMKLHYRSLRILKHKICFRYRSKYAEEKKRNTKSAQNENTCWSNVSYKF